MWIKLGTGMSAILAVVALAMWSVGLGGAGRESGVSPTTAEQAQSARPSIDSGSQPLVAYRSAPGAKDGRSGHDGPSDLVLKPTGPDPTPGPSDLVGNGPKVLKTKYCGDTKVDDDITDCDITEIAYACPDGKTPSSGECTAYPSGSFPD